MCQPIEKSVFRKQILKQRSALCNDFIRKAEEIFLNQLEKFSPYQSSKTIMLYWDYRNEAPTSAILNHALKTQKKVILPVTDENFKITAYEFLQKENALLTSKLGIREPNPLVCPQAKTSEIDFVLIPGIAFDKYGNRIGFGKGCYDFFLPKLHPNAIKVGLAYEFQLLERIPSEVTDIPMDFILTEKRICQALHSQTFF